MPATKVDVSKIHGKIRIVKRFPDFKIQIVETDADLEVELVETCCCSPGKWKLVSGHGDYLLKVVKANPDFTVSCKDKIKPAH